MREFSLLSNPSRFYKSRFDGNNQHILLNTTSKLYLKSQLFKMQYMD